MLPLITSSALASLCVTDLLITTRCSPLKIIHHARCRIYHQGSASDNQHICMADVINGLWNDSPSRLSSYSTTSGLDDSSRRCIWESPWMKDILCGIELSTLHAVVSVARFREALSRFLLPAFWCSPSIFWVMTAFNFSFLLPALPAFYGRCWVSHPETAFSPGKTGKILLDSVWKKLRLKMVSGG